MPQFLTLYYVAIAFAAIGTGIQMVSLPWLAMGELNLSAEGLGWVQFCQLLPGALLLPISGVFADRAGSERYLPIVYMLLPFAHWTMAGVISGQWMSLPLVLIYAAILGSGFALIQPLRDRILPGLLGVERRHLLQRAVVLASACIYSGQGIGVILGGRVAQIGIQGVLIGQGACLLLAALLLMSLQRRQQRDVTSVSQPSIALGGAGVPAQSSSDQRQKPGIRAGIRYSFRHPVLRHLLILVAFNGFVNLGTFMVAMPLLTRDVYHQEAEFFAWLQLCFVAGNVIATLALLRRGTIDQPGRSVLFCLVYTAMIMLAISWRPTAVGLLGLVFCWGVVAGVSASLGKALLQQQVNAAYRGRVLSIYFLALLGGAPLGALACGLVMHSYSELALFRITGVVSLLFFIAYLGVPNLWKVAPPRQSV